uniref:Endonuclease/exonuclease/phosphatase domain-containing protein n=1 Tax=Davidia involucrata TaxID=16924 RepID=A0A5B7BGF4_DAVIN
MKILGWNCRGLGNPQTVRALRQLVKEEAPNILFLFETKTNQTRMEFIKSQIGFRNGVFVDSDGKSGGLCLLWQDPNLIQLQSFSKSHIDVLVGENSDSQWCLIGFYGSPDASQRSISWALLRSLRQQMDIPWLCLGDFNEILCDSEKLGMRSRDECQMRDFRKVLDDCGFRDLGFYENRFTWCNRRDGEANILERLDRAIATTDWCQRFFRAKVFHLVSSASDHSPIYVSLRPKRNYLQRRRANFFHFEPMWFRDENCGEVIRSSWQGG